MYTRTYVHMYMQEMYAVRYFVKWGYVKST